MIAPAPKEIGPITRTDIVRYQGASGDMNPVHHDEEFAKNAGYPAPLAVGMFQAGALAAWAADQLGPENVRRVRLRWREPVFPGETLSFRGRVIRKLADAVELELACVKESGAVAVEAWMTFVI